MTSNATQTQRKPSIPHNDTFSEPSGRVMAGSVNLRGLSAVPECRRVRHDPGQKVHVGTGGCETGLDRHGIPRHSDQDGWDDETLYEAAGLHESGLSLAAVGVHFGIDAQTVANRFRRAAVPVRQRRGWNTRAHSEHTGR